MGSVGSKIERGFKKAFAQIINPLKSFFTGIIDKIKNSFMRFAYFFVKCFEVIGFNIAQIGLSIKCGFDKAGNYFTSWCFLFLFVYVYVSIALLIFKLFFDIFFSDAVYRDLMDEIDKLDDLIYEFSDEQGYPIHINRWPGFFTSRCFCPGIKNFRSFPKF